MKAHIRAKIEKALAAEGLGRGPAPSPLPMTEVGLMVDRILNGEKQWTLKELEERMAISRTAIINRCRGRVGFRKEGRRILISDSLARQLIAEGLLAGLQSK